MSTLKMRSTKKYLCLLPTNVRKAIHPIDFENPEIKFYGIATGDGLVKVGTMLSGYEYDYRHGVWFLEHEPVFYIFIVDQDEIRFLEK